MYYITYTLCGGIHIHIYSRDRNREHAKNTRLRKKAYIMKLKELVDQMTRQRDIDEKDRRMLGEKVYDSQVIRKNAVRVFLHYRATNESNKEKWQTILDENVTFSQPITPYRSFNYGEIINSSRVIRGIDAMINDTASLGLMVETIGHGSEQWSNAIKSGRSSRVTISTGKDDMMVAGDIVMCRYIMKIEGTELTTPQSVCTQHGMMQCRFNKQNKITAIEIMFDVMGFMQQLQRASSSSPECCISPNTLDMALQPSMEARSLIKAVGDFCVMHVNEAWTQLTGTVQSEAEGKRFLDVCGVVYLQREQLYKLCLDATTGKAGSLVIVAFHKRPSPVNAVSTTFSHSHQTTSMGDVALSYIKLLPLTADSNKISHLLCVQTPLHLTPTEKANLTSKFVNGGPFQPCSMHANSASAAGAGASAAGVGAGASAGASAASSSSKMSTDGYDSSTIAAQEVFNMMDSSCMQPPPLQL